MKKRLLFTLMALFSLSFLFSQETREYSSDEIATLLADLEAAVDGDVFVLTTPGDQGFYKVDTSALKVAANITIRSASDVSVKPKLKLVYDETLDMTDYLICLTGENVSLTLYGIEIQGDTVNTKYGIRTAKISDMTDYTDYDDPNYDLSVVQNYELNIFNCDINGILKGSDGRGIILYPGTRGTVFINNTTFSAINRDAINMYNDSDNTAANGPWKFVDSLSVKNCTFYNIGREAINYRNSGESFVDNPASSAKIIVDHCTFNACGINSVSDSYYPMRVDAPQLFISNSIFSNMETKSYIIGANKNLESRIDYVAFWNVMEWNTTDEITEEFSDIEDAIEIVYDHADPVDTLTLGDSLWLNLLDPKYMDVDNADFSLASDSDVLGKGNDDLPLGDLRWTADYVDADNADLASVTINGNPLSGFSADVTSYTVELPASTVDVPEIIGTPLSPYAKVETEEPSALPGSATITVTSEDGFVTKEYEIFMFVGVSVQEDLANQVKVYPNPSRGSFTVSEASGATLNIYNITGKLVYTKTNLNANEFISTELPRGIYMLEIAGNNFRKVNKLVIK